MSSRARADRRDRLDAQLTATLDARAAVRALYAPTYRALGLEARAFGARAERAELEEVEQDRSALRRAYRAHVAPLDARVGAYAAERALEACARTRDVPPQTAMDRYRSLLGAFRTKWQQACYSEALHELAEALEYGQRAGAFGDRVALRAVEFGKLLANVRRPEPLAMGHGWIVARHDDPADGAAQLVEKCLRVRT
jgi:hypothetical protein